MIWMASMYIEEEMEKRNDGRERKKDVYDRVCKRGIKILPSQLYKLIQKKIDGVSIGRAWIDGIGKNAIIKIECTQKEVRADMYWQNRSCGGGGIVCMIWKYICILGDKGYTV